jgi:hypothetical protein
MVRCRHLFPRVAVIALLAGFPAGRAALAAEAPRVVITSRVPGDENTHIIGFLEGTDLKSAGIYQHGVKVKDIEVAGTPGSQRINFDFAIEAPSPNISIRVTDGLGRSAEAPVVSGPAEPPPFTAGAAESESPIDTAEPAPEPGSSGNTEEIPRYGGGGTVANDSPRRFPGGVGRRMTGVQIAIESVMPMVSHPGSYEITGQIVGSGVRRAGIYVNGRPVKPIPVATGSFTPFDVVFPLTGGRYATIRAYGAGRNYIEAPIDLTARGPSYINPYGAPQVPYSAAP